MEHPFITNFVYLDPFVEANETEAVENLSILRLSIMDNIVDALNNAYQEFLAAAAGVLEAREASGGRKTSATDAALENFKQHWELFRVACDQAEEFVESAKQRIGSECLVDEATGSWQERLGRLPHLAFRL
ncbi:hypothetical protein Nepgr_025404 [Nepenthes gracilis]|uniref:Mediator of RNA polymerase II transcription subunit 32 n=1 Tax=Nepenthes gracilis TaxID=150966 RepID=A0AAD3T6N1_NEPGR|nr:hypothetical protein Nepgr_025404 [Nepenthes gracilis]